MCIYCGTTHYRKIYQSHYGEIPRDSLGRSYEIHHIDGNRQNNNLSNLRCVSLEEHYQIHLSQKDWMACHRIAARLNLTFEEISELSRQAQKKLVEEGTHHLLGGEIQKRSNAIRVNNGTHNFLGESNPNHARIKAGIHPWQDKSAASARVQKRLADGNHPFIGGDLARQASQKMFEEGTHPSQKVRTCDVCGKVGKGPVMLKYHFEKCKTRFICEPVIKEPSPIYTCPHCNKSGDARGMKRHHGDSCKSLHKPIESNLCSCVFCGLVLTAKHIDLYHNDKCKLNPNNTPSKKPRQKVLCVHCNRAGDPSAMSRFHGDKCKYKK